MDKDMKDSFQLLGSVLRHQVWRQWLGMMRHSVQAGSGRQEYERNVDNFQAGMTLPWWSVEANESRMARSMRFRVFANEKKR
jgi:hypothetical protein